MPFDDGARWPIGRDHPSTSLDAAAATADLFATERERVLVFVCEAPAPGVPCASAADALRIVRNQAAISLQWLRRHDFVERVMWDADLYEAPYFAPDRDGHLTVPTGEKTRGIVHRATDKGHREYGRMRMEAARRA